MPDILRIVPDDATPNTIKDKELYLDQAQKKTDEAKTQKMRYEEIQRENQQAAQQKN